MTRGLFGFVRATSRAAVTRVAGSGQQAFPSILPAAFTLRLSHYLGASLLAMALASAWTATARADATIQVFLTSPDIQSGAQVPLVEFSGSLARRGEPYFDGARACGLNKIVKPTDTSSSPQFVAALFNKTQISAGSIISTLQGTVFYQVDLTGIEVDEVKRSQTAPTASVNGLLIETIILHATTVKFTYQPVLVNGQKNGTPVTFGWNCVTNTSFGGS